MGCSFSAGCIGGVHTHEEYRKRGLATQLLLHVLNRFRNEGGDFLAISGRRDLYYRNHAMLVGDSHRFTLSPEQANSLRAEKIKVHDFKEAHLADLARIHAMEPVRVIRPKRVWDFFLQTRACHFAPSRTYVAALRGASVAYLIVRGENRDGMTEICEFAGDRVAVCASLGHALERQKGQRITFAAMGWDSSLIAHMRAHEIEPATEATSGALRVINFERTLDKYRPRLAELVGSEAARDLSIQAGGDDVTFKLGQDSLKLSVDAATKLLFGAPPGEEELDLGSSMLAEVLLVGFPIPLPAYGMDYV